MRNYYYFQLQNEWHEHVWNYFGRTIKQEGNKMDLYGKA